MLSITFEYCDEYSHFEWRKQHCVCSSIEECIKFYGLNEPGVLYQILEIKEA